MFKSGNLRLSSFIGNLQGRGRFDGDTDRQQFENSQAQSAQKVLNYVECQPKEKHIRNLILGTYREEGSFLFWTILANGFAFESNHIIAWKFCYLFHRLLRDGHPNVIRDSMPVSAYVQQLGVFWQDWQNNYGSILGKYCTLLSTKLSFHDKHRFIPGNLQCKFGELQSQVNRSNDAYFEISADIMDYLDGLLHLQTAVFNSIHKDGTFSHTAPGQCRLCPILCCLQEANNLYDLLVKLLFEMNTVLNPSDLQGHRVRFKDTYKRLQSFYHVSSSYKFLKDRLTIPSLTKMPNFTKKDDIVNYITPVCQLHSDGNTEGGARVSNNTEYDYPASLSWINRTSSQSTMNEYSPEFISREQSIDLAKSHESSSLSSVQRVALSVPSQVNVDLLSLDSPFTAVSSDSLNAILPVSSIDVQLISNSTTVDNFKSDSTSPEQKDSSDDPSESIDWYKSELESKQQVIRSMQARLIFYETSQQSSPSAVTVHSNQEISDLTAKCSFYEDKYEKMKDMYNKLRLKHVDALQQLAAKRKLRRHTDNNEALISVANNTEMAHITNDQISTYDPQSNDIPQTDAFDPNRYDHLIQLNQELKEKLQILSDDKESLERELEDLRIQIERSKSIDDNNLNTILTTQQGSELIDSKQPQQSIDEQQALTEECKEMESRLVDVVHEHSILQEQFDKLTQQSQMDSSLIELLRNNVYTTQQLYSLDKKQICSNWADEVSQVCRQYALRSQITNSYPVSPASLIDRALDIYRLINLFPASIDRSLLRLDSYLATKLLELEFTCFEIVCVLLQSYPDYARSNEAALQMSEMFCAVATLAVTVQEGFHRNAVTCEQTMKDDFVVEVENTATHIQKLLFSLLTSIFSDNMDQRATSVESDTLQKLEVDITSFRSLLEEKITASEAMELRVLCYQVTDLIQDLFKDTKEQSSNGVKATSEYSVEQLLIGEGRRMLIRHFDIARKELVSLLPELNVSAMDVTKHFHLRRIVIDFLSYVGAVCTLEKSTFISRYRQTVFETLRLLDTTVLRFRKNEDEVKCDGSNIPNDLM